MPGGQTLLSAAGAVGFTWDEAVITGVGTVGVPALTALPLREEEGNPDRAEQVLSDRSRQLSGLRHRGGVHARGVMRRRDEGGGAKRVDAEVEGWRRRSRDTPRHCE